MVYLYITHFNVLTLLITFKYVILIISQKKYLVNHAMHIIADTHYYQQLRSNFNGIDDASYFIGSILSTFVQCIKKRANSQGKKIKQIVVC